jgi:RNA polymerase sigma factor (TIGR02999 family)
MTDHTAPPADERTQITALLGMARSGDAHARDALFARLYDELKRLARAAGAGQPGQTLNTTGIVHECYMRFVERDAQVEDRRHFFALAARVMRQILIDYARKRLTSKRGGGIAKESLDSDPPVAAEAEQLVALDSVLEKLAQQSERQARVVELKVFGGLTEPEIAVALDISLRTVQLDWQHAREWLAQNLP